MSLSLTREADNDTLTFDGLIDGGVIEASTATAHRIGSESPVIDHVEPASDQINVRVIVSEVGRNGASFRGVNGPGRVDAYLDWIRDARLNGRILAVDGLNRALRNNRWLLVGQPWDLPREGATEIRLSFVEYREATSKTVELAPLPAPREDIAAGAAGVEEDGVQPGEDRSALTALGDAATSIFGGGS